MSKILNLLKSRPLGFGSFNVEMQQVKQRRFLLEQSRKRKAPVRLALMEWTLDIKQEAGQLIEATFFLS